MSQQPNLRSFEAQRKNVAVANGRRRHSNSQNDAIPTNKKPAKIVPLCGKCVLPGCEAKLVQLSHLPSKGLSYGPRS